jgi:hypothetical protein
MGCCLKAQFRHAQAKGDYSGNLYDFRDTNECAPTGRRDSAKG